MLQEEPVKIETRNTQEGDTKDMDKKFKLRWQLVAYDIIILAFVDMILLGLYRGDEHLSSTGVLNHFLLTLVCVLVFRIGGSIYRQIWRYGGIQCYMRLLFMDGCAFILNLLLEIALPIERIRFSRLLSVACMNLLIALAMRMMYRYAYKCGNGQTASGKVLNLLLRIFAGKKVQGEMYDGQNKIKIAIIGAGRVGVSLAEELMSNAASSYIPRCFVDVSKDKANRSVHSLPVFPENEQLFDTLRAHEIQEVVFALPHQNETEKKELYDRYSQAGFKIKVYDYPFMQASGGRRQLRDFDMEELLFRKENSIEDARTRAYYKDKVILITGGGGSIGSELCRQIAPMGPKKIVILDIYENGAYDVQQELRIAYKGAIDIQIEIATVTNKAAVARVMEVHHPQIVIHAAAHKHVPLMERNCIEAVENNVFGTKNVVDLCETYGVERFMMVSTDKAVNPTNVMGATKRMCEMIVQSASQCGTVKCSSTRFGNVLGSAGSVIPLFKRQIAAGGPITITDKRIIRYFMTIPEASQLVLQSGAMADNGELFVLDMGKPVRILDLAENMIRLSGVHGIEIMEVGLRPGEKLYEELLIHTDELKKTDNKKIFIEYDEPLSKMEIEHKLELLKKACETGDDEAVREALHAAVPTFKEADAINETADEAEEMQDAMELAPIA